MLDMIISRANVVDHVLIAIRVLTVLDSCHVVDAFVLITQCLAIPILHITVKNHVDYAKLNVVFI